MNAHPEMIAYNSITTKLAHQIKLLKHRATHTVESARAIEALASLKLDYSEGMDVLYADVLTQLTNITVLKPAKIADAYAQIIDAANEVIM